MSVCMRVCLYVYPPGRPSVHPGHLSALLSGRTFVWLSVHPFVWMAVCLSICVSDCLICSSVRPSICVCLSVHLSVHHTHTIKRYRQVGRQTCIQRDRQTYRWTYKHTDGWNYIHVHINGGTHACVCTSARY